MSVCACIGPAGDCPCIRRQLGQKVQIQETYVSELVWNYLSDDEKEIINSLKTEAMLRMVMDKRKNNESSPAQQ